MKHFRRVKMILPQIHKRLSPLLGMQLPSPLFTCHSIQRKTRQSSLRGSCRQALYSSAHWNRKDSSPKQFSKEMYFYCLELELAFPSPRKMLYSQGNSAYQI